MPLILRQALAGDAADDLQGQGLGSRIAALFAEAALEEPIGDQITLQHHPQGNP